VSVELFVRLDVSTKRLPSTPFGLSLLKPFLHVSGTKHITQQTNATGDRTVMRKQRGSTFLGFILGALFGLGVALAVAVYVTKVPVPFMSKTLPRNPDGDAAEARKNRDWDPNAGLANKPGVRPPVVPAAPPSPLEPRAAQTPASAPRVGSSTDPLGDLAKARTSNSTGTAVVTPAAPSAGIDPFNYFIQVGAFRTPEDAEQQRARVSLMGLQARVTEREQSGRTVYRVRLGPFDRKEDADKAKEKLDAGGVETALVRVQR
jgi:cell division protein FtsN